MVAGMRDDGWWEVGRQLASHYSLCKNASTPETVHKLGGKLYLSKNGWLLVNVPNSLVRGAFDALHAPGAELPSQLDGSLNAHISVMRPEEVAKIGADKLTERGHTFYYTLGPIKEITPLSWDDVSKVWVIEVDSPGLRDLRKSYGLSPLPRNDHEYHITIAVRRKNVLRDNVTAKFDIDRARTVDTKLEVKAASVAFPASSLLDEGWEYVPTDVVSLLSDVTPHVKLALQQLTSSGLTTYDAALLYHVPTKTAYTHAVRLAGFTELMGKPDDLSEFVHVKLAGALGDAVVGANKLIGGPNALTNTIVGGLATGGAGYLAGAAMEHLFPERYLERGKLRRTMGLLGAGAGATPGLWLASAKYRNAQAAGQSNPLTRAMFDSIPIAAKAASLCGLPDDWEPSFDLIKSAYFDSGGYVKPIPVDAFNRAVWNDVRPGSASQNQFGTKSPWGSNDEQTLHTPPAIAAATTGLLSGVSAMHGGASLIQPSTLVRGIARAGANLAVANVAGKTLGALAGLTPETQRQLQNTGVWAGVLSAVIPPVFKY